MTKQKNNKNAILLILGISILLGVLNLVCAEDGYCFVRLSNGQSVPAEVVSQTSHMICDGTRCSVFGFSSDSSFLQVCTDSRGYYAAYTNCDGGICSGGGGGGGGGQVQNLTLRVVFPFANGGVFTKQTFFMDITTNKVSKISLIDNVAGTERTLCPNCVSYQKSVNFKQGFNDITIRAMRGDEIIEKSITFFIDNLKPRISKTLPVQNKFANGDFTVSYDEANVKNIELSYGTSGNYLSKSLIDCPSGKAQSCLFNVDLSQFDGKQIEYWFTVTDVADNYVVSKKAKVFVDKTMPIVSNLDYSVKGNYLTINMSVYDKNLDKVVYYDNEDVKARVLCSGSIKGSCYKKLSFRSGHHVLDIQTSDKAGNVVSDNIEFDI